MTGLEDFSIVSYDVGINELSQLLPTEFRPITFSVDGQDRGLVSAVIFRDLDFHFRVAPWPRMNCGQVNYRAYVTRGSETGVWFFGTSLDHWLTGIPRRFWGMPWHREPISVLSEWRAGALASYEFNCRGDWGRGRVELAPTAQPVGLLPGIANLLQGSEVVLNPFIGWYRRARDNRIGRYEVWHAPLLPLRAEVRTASFAVFERLGLVEPEQPPLHAVVQRRTTFDVFTPPHRLPPTGW